MATMKAIPRPMERFQVQASSLCLLYRIYQAFIITHFVHKQYTLNLNPNTNMWPPHNPSSDSDKASRFWYFKPSMNWI